MKELTLHHTKEEACAIVDAAWVPKPGKEWVTIYDAHGRFAAEDLYATVDSPSCPVAAMDSIAVCFDDFQDGIPDTSEWVRDIDYTIADMGDPIAEGFDTAIRIEHVHNEISSSEGDDTICMRLDYRPHTRGEGIRPQGENFHTGDLLVHKGELLTSQRLAALAASHITELKIISAPRIALVPTGSELIDPEAPAQAGKTVDTNTIMLGSALAARGCEVEAYPIVEDVKSLIGERITELSSEHDIVLIIGGSSKGSEDFGVSALFESGELLYHWTNTAPGRPSAAGLVGSTLVCIIPGPPVGADTTLHWLVERQVSRWFGLGTRSQLRIHARKGTHVRTSSGDIDYWQRAVLRRDEGGDLIVDGLRGKSHQELSRANCIISAADNPDLAHSDTVLVIVNEVQALWS